MTTLIYNDLKPILERFNIIPKGEIDSRMTFPPPPPLPMGCRVCGSYFGDVPVNWVDIQRALKDGKGDKAYAVFCVCPECEYKEGR